MQEVVIGAAESVVEALDDCMIVDWRKVVMVGASVLQTRRTEFDYVMTDVCTCQWQTLPA